MQNPNSRLSYEVANTRYQNDCAEGRRQDACPGGAAGLIAFGITMVATAGIAEYALFTGGVASTFEAVPSILESGFRSIVIACLKSILCARMIGAGEGITVLGKIKAGENPPKYAQVGDQVRNGRYLFGEWSKSLQLQFMEQTKALGNPVVLADNPAKYPNSWLAAEVDDLLGAGWTMILNVLMYPPR